MTQQFYLIFLLALISQSLTQISQRMVGGDFARPGQFPFLVSIQITFDDINYEHYCGGAILSPTWILTAAHCLRYHPNMYRAVAGVAGLNDETRHKEIRNVNRFVFHPKFFLINDYHLKLYDFGLVEIDGMFKFNPQVFSIKLPEDKAKFKGPAILAGWGTLDRTATQFTNRLKYITISIPEQISCSQYYLEFNSAMHLCTCPLYYNGPCYGDNGSPLIQNGTIIGIVSSTSYPCSLRSPFIFAKVSAALPFITEMVPNLEAL